MFFYFGKKEPPPVVDGLKSWVSCHHLVARDFRKQTGIAPPKGKYHHHDYIELLYSIDTDANIFIDSESFPFNTGDFVIVYSNELHAFLHRKAPKMICIQFSPHILYADEQSLPEFKYLNPALNENKHQRIFHHGRIEDLNIEALVMETMREWQQKDSGYELIIRSNILKIFAKIYRIWSRDNNLSSDKAFPDAIKKAIVYISENISTVTEKDVADFVGLNRNYFSDLFKKTIGKKFTDYITTLKIQKATHLILTTNKNMYEISIEAGFSTPSYFTSQFKKHKNMTPKQFRKKIDRD